jgi:hypothetical protein
MVWNLGKQKASGFQKGRTPAKHRNGVAQVFKNVPDYDTLESVNGSEVLYVYLTNWDVQDAATDIGQHLAAVNTLSVETVVQCDLYELASATSNIQDTVAVPKVLLDKVSLEVRNKPAARFSVLPLTIRPVVVDGQVGKCCVFVDIQQRWFIKARGSVVDAASWT